MRKRLWQIHSWLGLICGLALILIGLTGSVLVFHKEITKTVSGDIVLTKQTTDASRLPLDELVSNVRAAYPDFWVSGWLPNHDGDWRDLAYLRRVDTDDWHKMRVDQFTGEMVTDPIPLHDTLHGWFVDLHYTFFADHLGLAITAIFALGLIALSITGVWIHRRFWANFFRLRWSASARIFSSDLHKAIGIVSAPLNLLLGFTGAYWNIAHLVHEMTEHEHHEHVVANVEEDLPLARLTQIATDHWPGYQLNYMYFPTEEDPNIYFYGYNETPNPLHSPYGSWMGIDASSGKISLTQDLRTAGLWTKILDTFEPLHFGDFGGIVSKSIWFLAGLSPGTLAVTGAIIYFSRKRKRRASLGKASPRRQETVAVNH